MAAPASAADGNILPPFNVGESWTICRGYNYASHTGTSSYGIDLTGSGCDNSASGRTVRAPISGSIYYYQASYGNLCVNIADGRSYTLTHIDSSLTSGSVSAGQAVGNVAAPGNRGNAGVSHIHFEIWDTPNCYSSSGIPFDSAHGTRICGAPDLTASGPNWYSNGTWSGTNFAGQNCGVSTPPLVVTNNFYLNNDFDGFHDIATSYGNPYDTVLHGDWNGDGVETWGLRIGGTYYLNNTFDGSHDFETHYGDGSQQVLVGDWDGDGIDTLGVRVGGTYYLNNNFDGTHDIETHYGGASDEVLVGDWNGDGIDTLGIRQGNAFYLNNNFDGYHDILTYYGNGNEQVVVGDWDGDGVDTLGVRVGNAYYLNNNFDGSHDIETHYGDTIDHIFSGDWNGDGIDNLGIRDVYQP